MSSGNDQGTLYHMRNRLNRTNVPSEVKKDFNACEDFLQTVTSGSIVAATLSVLGMNSVSDAPDNTFVPEDMWMESKEERKECFEQICIEVYDRFISLSLGTPNYAVSNNDSISSYAIQLLRIGCLCMEFADAIREGDGERVLRCWRYFVPVFRASHSFNYACESLYFLHQHSFALSPRLSNQLIWGRFVNVHGLPGRNIPLDLHMEHLNRVAKGAMKNLSSNKTRVASVTRIGRSIGVLYSLLENFDSEHSVRKTSSKYRKPSATSGINIVIEELMASMSYDEDADERDVGHFSNVKNLFNCIQEEDLIDWMVGRLK